jgi:hypothetical protein
MYDTFLGDNYADTNPDLDGGLTSSASSLAVTGFPSAITAGNSGSFTVTAKNADGTTDTNC